MTTAATAPDRRKLWQQQDFQCPILGTCLSMAELRKLARKLGIPFAPGATDYEIHVRFVREASVESPASHYINKYLDKKYRSHIRQFAKAQDADTLEAMWKFSLKSGDIPGPFWAVLSHPGTGAGLRVRVFGDIHMLSHLMGAANRADIRRVSVLERRLDELGQALSKVQAARRSQKLEWAVRVKDLEDRLEVERGERLKLARKIRESVNAAGNGPAQVRDAAHAPAQETEAVREEARRQAAIIEELYRENQALRQQVGELSAELERADRELACALPCGGAQCGEGCGEGCGEACASGTGQCPCPELCGKNVLYVGGRCSLVRHYRQLVERAGCRFHHHDGGVEHSPGELYGKLASADVVLCPVDCVSHDACQAVKKACKHCMKPFMMLRSSGLSALARSLDQLAANVN
ncbi:MAG: DUF2325 domain-containing protein [Acidobacteriota bacterium]